MTGASTQRGNHERLEATVVDLIVVMRRLTDLTNSSAGSLLDGTLTPTGELCLAQLKATAATLAETARNFDPVAAADHLELAIQLLAKATLAETEPASLDDLAAVVAFSKMHCTIGMEAARNFDPVAAADQLDLAIQLLAKATQQLETMTGRSADEIGPAQRLH